MQFFCIRNCTFGHEFPENFEIAGGHFRSEKFRCKFSAGHHEFMKKLQTKSRKRGGGGQRPFGNFPKIHPFWRRQASLRKTPSPRLDLLFVHFHQGPLSVIHQSHPILRQFHVTTAPSVRACTKAVKKSLFMQLFHAAEAGGPLGYFVI